MPTQDGLPPLHPERGEQLGKQRSKAELVLLDAPPAPSPQLSLLHVLSFSPQLPSGTVEQAVSSLLRNEETESRGAWSNLST